MFNCPYLCPYSGHQVYLVVTSIFYHMWITSLVHYYLSFILLYKCIVFLYCDTHGLYLIVITFHFLFPTTLSCLFTNIILSSWLSSLATCSCHTFFVVTKCHFLLLTKQKGLQQYTITYHFLQLLGSIKVIVCYIFWREKLSYILFFPETMRPLLAHRPSTLVLMMINSCSYVY